LLFLDVENQRIPFLLRYNLKADSVWVVQICLVNLCRLLFFSLRPYLNLQRTLQAVSALIELGQNTCERTESEICIL